VRIFKIYMHHRGAKQCNRVLALAMEPSILVNSTGMSGQRAWLLLKSYVVCWWSGCCVMSLSSHVDNDITEATWSRHDVDAESCWRRCWWVMLAMVISRRLGRDVIYMSSHAGDGAAESCWWRRCRGDLAITRCRCRVMLTMALPRRLACDVM
jgi:hypothetical protein